MCSTNNPGNFLKCIGDNIPTQEIKKPTSKDTLPDLILRNKKEPVRDLNVRNNLGCRGKK